ncbi:vacuolar family H+-ATPase subunit H [Hominifimenecus sp. rT4P-3]|uniref:vacuolar family H+-ATPase subunit H n=1 Tax=Hominifimenecus sp. rT4P-3 TaxID=3242979 RepID=UPI003DA6248E
MSRIEQMIGEIEMYLDSCKSQAFSNSKRIVVEKDVIDEMLVELRLRTPEEIKKYQKIIVNKDAILSDAQAHADAILAEASRQTAELVNEHEIMQQAYAQAEEIVQQAQAQAQKILDDAVIEANSIRDGSVQYTDSQLEQLESILAHALENSQSRFQSFLNQLQASYDVIVSNRKELAPSLPAGGRKNSGPEIDIALDNSGKED